jgi:hypothetical protein
MPTLDAPDYTIARFAIERGVALIYAIAFLVAANQFAPLAGERGLQPAPRLLARTRFLQTPSLFHWGYTDRRLAIVAWTGVALSLLLVVGLPQRAPLPVTMATWVVVWILYQSIVNIGGTFYGFGWESLLLEAGFLAIFLGNDTIAPPWLIILAFRWLAFRVEFGAGLIKLRGDPCWRELRCMDYHHETQPMPNPMSWFFHHLPRPLHRVEVLGNFVAQLILPFGLFLPQPFASIAATLMILTQLYLVVSGNYAWLNWLTIVACASGIADPVAAVAGTFGPTPTWFGALVVAVAGLVVVLSWWPVRNMASPGQAMNASFNPFHIVNTYGAFGTVGRTRYEVVVEGAASASASDDQSDAWREYGFKGKPGDPARLPPQVAPYHHRLDWQIWFIPLSPVYGGEWFLLFLVRLLEGDARTLKLLRRNPFPDAPPALVRARLVRYTYTSWREWRETGRWWARTLVEEYIPPFGLGDVARAGRGRW